MAEYSADLKIPFLVRFAFTQDLFTAKEDDRGNKKWNCTILIPKTADISPVAGMILEAATKQWGDKAKQWLADGLIKSPVLDGDGKQGLSKKTGERHDGFAGHWFIRSSSGFDYRPAIFGPKLEAITDKNQFVSGVYGHAVIYAYTWENKDQGKGVSITLRMAQKVRDSEKPLGGGGGTASPDAYFEKIEDTGAMPESAKGGDGAAGLFG